MLQLNVFHFFKINPRISTWFFFAFDVGHGVCTVADIHAYKQDFHHYRNYNNKATYIHQIKYSTLVILLYNLDIYLKLPNEYSFRFL